LTDQQPSIGRIVHYVSYGTPGGEYKSECRAAVVTAVRDSEPVPEHGVPYVDLFVMNPTGVFLNQSCKYDAGGTSDTPGAPTARSFAGGSWHWPERV
jgi:hypothetical protein